MSRFLLRNKKIIYDMVYELAHDNGWAPEMEPFHNVAWGTLGNWMRNKGYASLCADEYLFHFVGYLKGTGMLQEFIIGDYDKKKAFLAQHKSPRFKATWQMLDDLLEQAFDGDLHFAFLSENASPIKRDKQQRVAASVPALNTYKNGSVMLPYKYARNVDNLKNFLEYEGMMQCQ